MGVSRKTANRQHSLIRIKGKQPNSLLFVAFDADQLKCGDRTNGKDRKFRTHALSSVSITCRDTIKLLCKRGLSE